MAEAVATTFEAGGMLVVEAGTGTGKTLAYLVPAVLSGKRVLISTGTRNSVIRSSTRTSRRWGARSASTYAPRT